MCKWREKEGRRGKGRKGRRVEEGKGGMEEGDVGKGKEEAEGVDQSTNNDIQINYQLLQIRVIEFSCKILQNHKIKE